ncbi:glycoside hydrolase [Marinilabiliaceae bacterium JC017]|nr:glycoside hydrolase [Marinilabiliaceae bacterium JC017]
MYYLTNMQSEKRNIKNLFTLRCRVAGLFVILFLGNNILTFSQVYDKVLGLEGQWRFSIGDNRDYWASENFDDSSWDRLNVPGNWEEQGYNGYDGFAWYRKTFSVPDFNETKTQFILRLGYIDDVDEVFVNGEKIGQSGTFPPHQSTAYNARREYVIPQYLIKKNSTNVIAVRVYDFFNEGGILKGEIGLYANRNPLLPDLPLEGMWQFKTGDNMQWRFPEYNATVWEEIMVPSLWEEQGFRHYDGMAWYRKTFMVDEALTGQKLVLLLGKIDDIDEVYINGVLVGQTGDMGPGKRHSYNFAYNELRGYYIPRGLLLNGKPNVICVRVFDSGIQGGIYEGPVGLITQDKYIRYWRQRKKRR